MSFQIGDEVEFIKPEFHDEQTKRIGKITICCFDEGGNPEDTEEPNIGLYIQNCDWGHQLSGVLPESSRNGWWTFANRIRLVNKSPVVQYRISMDGFRTCDEHWNTFELLR